MKVTVPIYSHPTRSNDNPLNDGKPPEGFSAHPYPLYQGEDLSVLRNRHQSEFPNPLMYPPPPGDTAQCGCVRTHWDDEHILLETIWQPYWDFRAVSAGQGRLDFFQDASREKQASGRCNMFAQAACFNWPKRYHLWEIAFMLGSSEYSTKHFKNLSLDDAKVRIVIGEKDHLSAPLSIFSNRSPVEGICSQIGRHIFLPLPLPLYIPPAQNFRVSLEWNGEEKRYADYDGAIRCVLGGYLSREIP
jgi:hypothetical protein